MHQLDKFFNPESIAVVGASRDTTKLGRMVLDNILNYGYRGKIYPVNPKAEEIAGLPTYPSIMDIPYEVDVAVILIPAKFVVDTIKQCATKGVKGAVIITSGFGESSEEGKQWEEQIREIAKPSGMRVLGPNCLGFINPKINLNASFSKNMPKSGGVGIISQSGAFGCAMLDWAEGSGVGFDLFVSIGNKVDLDENDVLEYWSSTTPPQIVASYLEDIRDGKRFVEINKELTARIPHVCMKPGKTEEAVKAIQSHTGSMAGSDQVVTTALKQSGVIRVDGMHDFFDKIRAFSLQPLPEGKRVAVVTNAGGPAVSTTDFVVEAGLEIARFDKRTIDILAERLPRAAALHDPVDVIGDALADRYADAIDIVLGDPNVDALIVLLTPQIMTQICETAIHIDRLQEVHGKPVLAAFSGGKYVEEGRVVLEQLAIPVYHYPERAVFALKTMVDYSEYKKKVKSDGILGFNKGFGKVDVTHKLNVDNIITQSYADNELILDPHECLEIARLYGLEIPQSKIVVNEDDAIDFAQTVGYPVVAKIASDKLMHKTELGGVELNLDTPEKVATAVVKLQGIVADQLNVPVTQVSGAVEIQKQIKGGHEVMIGVKKDPNFGHLILFGTGGIFTELYKDFSTRLAPLDIQTAKEMIRETKVYEILKGFRNLPKRDYACVAEVLVKISRLVEDIPQIEELDINPLIVLNKGKGCVAVDVKIKLEER